MAGRRVAKGKSVLSSNLENEVVILGRHVDMLKAILDNEPIGILRLSELLEYPQHKVRYSLRVLEQEGLIIPSPEGAVSTDKLVPFMRDLRMTLDDMSVHIVKLRARVEQFERSGPPTGKSQSGPGADGQGVRH